MPTEQTVTGRPAAAKMTLLELEQFIAKAKAAGPADSVIPKVRIAFGGGIKSITATVPQTGHDLAADKEP